MRVPPTLAAGCSVTTSMSCAYWMSSASSTSVVCGKAAEPCDPGDDAALYQGRLECIGGLLENGLEREDCLAFRAVYEAPAGNSSEL